MSAVPMTTTNAQGKPVTIISVKGPNPGPEPTGASIRTTTFVGLDGAYYILHSHARGVSAYRIGLRC